MKSAKLVTWAATAAVLGGVMAVVLTPPFATAYFLAFPGEDALPLWFEPATSRLDWLIVISSGDGTYEFYGRIFNLVYVLFLPITFQLHRLHEDAGSRLETRGFTVVVAGLILAAIGVAGDYWADGMGFLIEVVGLLTIAVGLSMYGLALRRSKVLPSWCAWMFVMSGPGMFAATFGTAEGLVDSWTASLGGAGG